MDQIDGGQNFFFEYIWEYLQKTVGIFVGISAAVVIFIVAIVAIISNSFVSVVRVFVSDIIINKALVLSSKDSYY